VGLLEKAYARTDRLRDVARQDGIAVLVSLHQTEYARRFADRIVALSAGRVLFDRPAGATDEAAIAGVYPAVEAAG
jgi:phosphonate transport system ATP-binding protein